jgi:hypothetical protein
MERLVEGGSGRGRRRNADGEERGGPSADLELKMGGERGAASRGARSLARTKTKIK